MTRNHLFSVVVSMMMMCGSNVSECERVRSGEKNFLSDSTKFQQDSSQEMSALDDQDVLSGDHIVEQHVSCLQKAAVFLNRVKKKCKQLRIAY